jgi:hypothetical protein
MGYLSLVTPMKWRNVMNKATKKTVSINDLVVDLDLNNREVDNYDLPSMCEQIVAIGRIVVPLIVKFDKPKNKYIVLRGNRRTLAAQQLVADPNTSQEIVTNLSKVEVMVYEDLTPAEELAMVFDHGSEKPICRTEVVKSVWRLSKSFLSEGEIINMLYFALAKYSGNEKKLNEVPSEKVARSKFLKSWLHGTVGNYILSAAGMGDFVQEQFILTHRKEDKLITKEEETRLVMKTSRDRITQLSAAKTADSDANKGGKGWTAPEYNSEKVLTGGGENFNALIEKFKEEDSTGITAKNTRPSVKDLNEKANVYKSIAIKTALAIAAGQDVAENGKKLVEMDAAVHALTMKCEILSKYKDKLNDPKVTELVNAILNGPAGGVEVALKPYIA